MECMIKVFWRLVDLKGRLSPSAHSSGQPHINTHPGPLDNSISLHSDNFSVWSSPSCSSSSSLFLHSKELPCSFILVSGESIFLLLTCFKIQQIFSQQFLLPFEVKVWLRYYVRLESRFWYALWSQWCLKKFQDFHSYWASSLNFTYSLTSCSWTCHYSWEFSLKSICYKVIKLDLLTCFMTESNCSSNLRER